MAEENNEKKSVMEWLAEHPKAVFATRAIAWFVFAAVLPFLFIALRYGIFRDSTVVALNGWGIIGVVILVVFAIALLNYLRQGLEEGFLKQVVMGIVKIIVPLLAILIIIRGIKSDIELFEKVLGVTIACEFVAIFINPFPEWLEKRRKEKNLKEQESMFGALWDKFFAKKKENENDESVGQ